MTTTLWVNETVNLPIFDWGPHTVEKDRTLDNGTISRGVLYYDFSAFCSFGNPVYLKVLVNDNDVADVKLDQSDFWSDSKTEEASATVDISAWLVTGVLNTFKIEYRREGVIGSQDILLKNVYVDIQIQLPPSGGTGGTGGDHNPPPPPDGGGKPLTTTQWLIIAVVIVAVVIIAVAYLRFGRK